MLSTYLRRSHHLPTAYHKNPNILDVMIVRMERSNQSHGDFRVRRSVLLGTLQWLVDDNAISALMLTSLLNYPKDGDCTVTLNDSHEEQNPLQQEVVHSQPPICLKCARFPSEVTPVFTLRLTCLVLLRKKITYL